MNTQIIYSYYPAEWHKNLWREGFCAGNGKTGINTIGAICNDFFVITRTDLWYGLKKAELPDVSYKLKEMRVLRKNNEFKKAKNTIEKEIKSKKLPEVEYFMKKFVPAFEKTLDELDY